MMCCAWVRALAACAQMPPAADGWAGEVELLPRNKGAYRCSANRTIIHPSRPPPPIAHMRLPALLNGHCRVTGGEGGGSMQILGRGWSVDLMTETNLRCLPSSSSSSSNIIINNIISPPHKF